MRGGESDDFHDTRDGRTKDVSPLSQYISADSIIDREACHAHCTSWVVTRLRRLSLFDRVTMISLGNQHIRGRRLGRRLAGPKQSRVAECTPPLLGCTISFFGQQSNNRSIARIIRAWRIYSELAKTLAGPGIRSERSRA